MWQKPRRNKEETKKKDKSIWKDVSELPDSSTYIFLKWNTDGEIFLADYLAKKHKIIHAFNQSLELEPNDARFKSFCTLTDFINSFEQLEGRVERIEELIKPTGLVGKLVEIKESGKN